MRFVAAPLFEAELEKALHPARDFVVDPRRVIPTLNPHQNDPGK
ncbi:MAG TPA: hypothetical protein VJ732_09590 [Bryobacteraceae bacterium]|nr:hypothetical protein [Bryobacteraceae bacterium]